LNHSDLIVEALDKAQRDLVLGEAVGCDSLPIAVDHLGEFLERFQFLTLQGRTPVLEKLPGPGNAAVFPELSEGLLEQVGLQQRPQGLLAIQGDCRPASPDAPASPFRTFGTKLGESPPPAKHTDPRRKDLATDEACDRKTSGAHVRRPRIVFSPGDADREPRRTGLQIPLQYCARRENRGSYTKSYSF